MLTKIDVVILTWNDQAHLAEAVHSVVQSEGVTCSLIVVDNGSEPPATLSPAGTGLLLRNRVNRGVAAARNQGARAGQSELICFLDSDARLHPDCLQRLAMAVASDPRVALAAPVFSGQPPEASAGQAPTLRRKLKRAIGMTSAYQGTMRDSSAANWEVDFAIGACQLFKRAAYETVAGLDESYFYGPEDVDFCLRLREAGWRILQVAEAQCEHPPRRRFRRPLSMRGAQHAVAVTRYLWRHRRFQSGVRPSPQ